MNSVYIIAEAGVNHNGSLQSAIELVDAALDTGADAIKFQSFKADKLVTARAKKAAYQNNNQNDGKTQLEMLQALELSETAQQTLFDYCQQQSIDFLSSPFDQDSFLFLLQQLGLKKFKIGSGEITNAQLLYQLGQADVDVILSTGMSTMAEIHHALSVLAYGYSNKTPPACSADYSAALDSAQGKLLLAKHVTLMHCTTEYPCPVEEVNLAAIKTISDTFTLPCGYSDHTSGIHISLAAAALGATIIEKHFTLDKQQPGPDHKASIEPSELKTLVNNIRDIERAMGDGIKQVTVSEAHNKNIVRKGIYASCSIKKGERLTQDNVILKRPICQHQGVKFWDIIGTFASKDYLADEAI